MPGTRRIPYLVPGDQLLQQLPEWLLLELVSLARLRAHFDRCTDASTNAKPYTGTDTDTNASTDTGTNASTDTGTDTDTNTSTDTVANTIADTVTTDSKPNAVICESGRRGPG